MCACASRDDRDGESELGWPSALRQRRWVGAASSVGADEVVGNRRRTRGSRDVERLSLLRRRGRVVGRRVHVTVLSVESRAAGLGVTQRGEQL